MAHFEHYKLEFGFLGLDKPYYKAYIVCDWDNLEQTAKFIVMGRLGTLKRTYCDSYDENHHCERLWINR